MNFQQMYLTTMQIIIKQILKYKQMNFKNKSRVINPSFNTGHYLIVKL